jgi:hypothetical protein
MMNTTQKLATRERAKGWREVADSLYARAVFAEIVQPMLDRPLTEIARDLNSMHVPKVRGVDRWTAPDVTRLLARVAAVASEKKDASND